MSEFKLENPRLQKLYDGTMRIVDSQETQIAKLIKENGRLRKFIQEVERWLPECTETIRAHLYDTEGDRMEPDQSLEYES